MSAQANSDSEMTLYPRLFCVHFRYILISYRCVFLHTYQTIQIWPNTGHALCVLNADPWEADWTLTYREWLSEVLVFGHLMARASAEVLFVVGGRSRFGFRTVRLDRCRLQGCCGRSGRASRRVRGPLAVIQLLVMARHLLDKIRFHRTKTIKRNTTTNTRST